MLYATPAPEEPLSQGDILDACPIFGLEVPPTGVDLDAVPARWQERVIVLTQACDLAQTKTTKVRVALVHPAQLLVERGNLESCGDSGPAASGVGVRVVFPSGGPCSPSAPRVDH